MRELFIGCIETHAHGHQVTVTSMFSQSDVCIQRLMEAYFEILKQSVVSKKIIHYLCESRKDKSAPPGSPFVISALCNYLRK